MMWREISIDFDKFLLRHNRLNEVCVIYLTNLRSIWIEEVPIPALIRRCKEKNPLIEADNESLVLHIMSLLDTTKGNVTFRSTVHETFRTLEVITRLASVPFHVTFKMNLMSPDVLYQEVTRPIMLLANQLTNQQKVLCELLEAKDVEIEEYKIEGAQLKRRKLETKPFSRSEFLGSMSLTMSIITNGLPAVLCEEENTTKSERQEGEESNGTIPHNRYQPVEDNSLRAEATNSITSRNGLDALKDSSHQAEISNGTTSRSGHRTTEANSSSDSVGVQLHPSSNIVKEDPDTRSDAKKRKQTKPKLRL